MNTPLPNVVRRLRSLAQPATGDAALVQAFATRRDEGAFAELVRRHGPMVYGVCRRLLGDADAADDAFQATFLVLARKANAVNGRPSIGPWLYGVASRVARRARRSSYRRQYHESRILPAEMSARDEAWEELRLVLDEELSHLPERLRAPLVLCYLEGQTRDEAAQQLGCTFGALKRRLEDGRTRLRNRLVRRGVALSAGLTLALCDSPLPAALVEQTLRTACGGPVPSRISSLVSGALPMIHVRWKMLLGLLLVLGGVVTGTLWPAGAQPPKNTERAKAETPAAAKRDRFNDALPDGAVARLGSTALCHGDWSNFAVFSVDGKRILSISFKLACVWDAASGQLVTEFGRPGDAGSWLAGAFCADGKTVCLVHDDAVARVYDLDTKLETRSFSLKGERPRQRQMMRVAFTPDGKTMAAVETDDSVRIWDVPSGSRGALIQVEGKVIRAFDIAPGSRTMATFDEDSMIRIWSAATGQELVKFPGTSRDLKLLAFSPDGNWVATVCQTAEEHTGHDNYTTLISDSFVHVWSVTKGEMVRHIEAHSKGIASIRFAPDSQSICTGGYGLDPFVRRWDLATGKKTLELPQQSNAITALDVSSDGKSLLSETNGILRVWDAQTGREKLPFDAHRGALSKLVLLPDGRVMSAGGDGTVREWEIATGKQLRRIDVQPRWVSDFVRSSDGRRLASLVHSQEKPEIRIFDAAGKLLRTLEGKGAAIGCLAFSPDGRQIATGDYAGKVMVWNVETGEQIKSLKAAGERGSDLLMFTADGKTLLGASIDDPFCAWDVATGERKWTRDPFALGLMAKESGPGGDHPERAMGLAFSADGKFVALGVQGASRILICELETGKLVEAIANLPGTPVSIAFSPDGKTIAWGTWEGPVHLCDRATGGELRQFTGHRGRVLTLVYTADSKFLISGSEDTTGLVWAIAE
ncbi:MAG: sigma-70 family RNA polymerase sigma factor [Gemmataceae bacterium]